MGTIPSLSGALAAGQVRVFANVYSAMAPQFSNIVWFAGTKWLQQNAETSKRLVKGIFATAQYANTHQAETAEILVRVAKLDPATVSSMTRAFFATSNDPKYVQAPLDFSYKYGLISRPVTVAEIMGGK
jgi:ABC-type nitrate/sulfonate/bicarbonate transport system substrate-binding protein